MGLKIGFVFDDTLDTLDGVQQHIVTLGRELERRGHEVHYLVGETHHSPVDHTHVMSRNIEVAFNGNHMRIPLPADREHIQQVLDEEQFDILHVQAPYSPMMAGRVLDCADERTGVVATYHIATSGPLSDFGGKLLGRINSRSHWRVDETIAVSQVAAQYAQRTANVRGVVIANPVDVAALRAERDRVLANQAADVDSTSDTTVEPASTQVSPLNAEGPHIVFLGRFVKRKGADVLLDALDYGVQHDLFPAGTHVTFAGKGPLLEECEQRAERINLPIHFAGFVPEESKPALLASADVAVFPATGGESFGIVLLEAIASGARVMLAGDNPGYRSTMLDDDDALFDVTSEQRAQVLAERIARALTDEPWAQALQTREQTLLDRYDVQQVANQVERVYEQAMKDRCMLKANAL